MYKIDFEISHKRQPMFLNFLSEKFAQISLAGENKLKISKSLTAISSKISSTKINDMDLSNFIFS